MNSNIKKAAALALAVSGAGAFVSSSINPLQMEVMAKSIIGIESLEICEKDSSDSVKLYKDKSYETSTKYKSSISKYYAKINSDISKFNVDIDTKGDYEVEIQCDGDDYDSGEEIDITKGETLTVKVKVYNEDDDLEGTITIDVERLSEDKEKDTSTDNNSNSSQGDTGSVSNANNNTSTIINGKQMAAGIDISQTSFFDGTSSNNESYTYKGTQTEKNNQVYRKQWVKKGLNWVYYDEKGNVIRDKWFQDGGKWYYLQSNGYMTTGWRFIENNWYYFDKNGAMVTGWMKYTDGKWYYFYSDGRMAANTTIDGYKINLKGAYIS